MSNQPWLKARRQNWFSLDFPTVPSLTAKPSEVTLYQEQFNHDVLEAVFSRPSSLWNALLKTGTPVVFTWAQDGRRKRWTGYVSHVSNQSAAQLERTMKVVCIGASYTLKKRDSKTWKNKTVTEVAALIAKQFKFKFVGEPSTRRFDQLSIAGQSYWSWLQEHAKQIGYSFYVDGTTMYMRPLNKQLKDAASNAPIMGLDIPSGAANQKHMDRTIDSFVIQKGDYFDFAANPYTIKSVSGVNPLTSKRIETKSSPTDSRAANTRAKASGPIFTDFGTEVVHSSAFSKAAAKDAAFAAKFNIMAKVRGQGDPRISPFGAVVLLNTGIDTDGFWAINKARHVFDITGLYEVELDIVTDGIGANSGDLFRKARGLVRGTIDIENALSAKLPRGADLIQRTPRFKETDQGFNDANSTWIGR